MTGVQTCALPIYLNLPTNTNIKSTGTVKSFFSETPSEVEELTKQIKTVQKNIRTNNIQQSILDKKQADENYKKQLEDWKGKNKELAARYQSVGFTQKATIPQELRTAGFPTPPAPLPDNNTLETQAKEEYDKQASKNVVFATEVNASGLASALNT